MNIKRYYWSVIVFLGTMLSISCSEQLESIGQQSKKIQIKAVFADFNTDGEPSTSDEQTPINDVQACLFENGIMTQVYTDLNKDNSEIQLQVDKMSGTLYMLANTAQQIDLNQMMASGITENEWLQHTVTTTDGQPMKFYAGSLKLDEQTDGEYLLLHLRPSVCKT